VIHILLPSTEMVKSPVIGASTSMWTFVHIFDGEIIGIECNIGDHWHTESNVTIANHVVVKNGVAR